MDETTSRHLGELQEALNGLAGMYANISMYLPAGQDVGADLCRFKLRIATVHGEAAMALIIGGDYKHATRHLGLAAHEVADLAGICAENHWEDPKPLLRLAWSCSIDAGCHLLILTGETDDTDSDPF